MKNNLTTIAFVRQPTEGYDSNIIFDVINGITGIFSNSLDKLQEELAAEGELQQTELDKDNLEILEQELKHSIKDELLIDSGNKTDTVRDKILSFY